MGVLDIKVDWKSLGLTRDKTSITVPVKYTVKFDDKDDPLNRPIIAYTASTSKISIPAMGKEHPYKQWLYVTDKTVSATDGPFLFEVLVKYSAALDWHLNNPVSPWNEKPKIRWGSIAVNEKIDRDIHGKPITNSADETSDPPPTENSYEMTLAITKNQKTFDPVKMEGYLNKLNSSIFYGFAKGRVLCVNITAEEAYYGKTKYYIVTCEFVIHGKTWEKGFTRRFLDEGFRVLEGNEKLPAPKEGYPKNITDANGDKISEPALLNGKGGLSTTGKGVWREFETKESISFSGLGV